MLSARRRGKNLRSLELHLLHQFHLPYLGPSAPWNKGFEPG